MSKGEQTRAAILERAFALAAAGGLSTLSIGRLADETGLSKSGLYAHFGSREALEVAIVEEASRQFVEAVWAPALKIPRGEPRLRAIFRHWLAWGQRPGGCFFVAASAEFDDRRGATRDALAREQKAWIGALAKATRLAVEAGHFRPDLDPGQFAFEAYSIMLGTHLFVRFLRTSDALDRTHAAFDALVLAARAPAPRRAAA
ncbi:MAG: TetR/AcrR family transcriptional regulator [Kofleriaceae bacterium]